MGRLAVNTGIVTLFEIDNGAFRLTAKSRSLAKGGQLKPISDYVNAQKRFGKIAPEEINELQRRVSQRWENYTQRDLTLPPPRQTPERITPPPQ